MQYQIFRVGASLFSGGAAYVYVLMALYSELAVCSCQIIDGQPVLAMICTVVLENIMIWLVSHLLATEFQN